MTDLVLLVPILNRLYPSSLEDLRPGCTKLTSSYTVYLAVVFGIHTLPNRWFAEFEFGTAACKVIMMFIIIFTCIAIIGGAGPTGSTHHAENYTQLPAFPNGYKAGRKSKSLEIFTD